jgi:hypothetical protein
MRRAATPTGKVWKAAGDSIEEVVARLGASRPAKMTADGVPDTAPLLAWGFDPIYFGARAHDGAAPRPRELPRAPVVIRPCQPAT